MTRVLIVFVLLFALGTADAQPSSAESEIQRFLAQMTAAWNRGDAAGIANLAHKDITFTILDGSVFKGRDVFESKHRGVLTGAFKGSTQVFTTRRVTFVRPDVALVDIDASISGGAARPVRSSLLLALEKEGQEWKIAGLHNTLQRSLSPD
jgi:uncharacterized protein (TIGR02246 family)